jgi:L-asparaginase II
VRRHPWWLGGTDRMVSRLVETVPGLVAKEGAEGVFAAALPDGRALAVKIVDGGPRPLPAVVVAALRAVEVDAPGLADIGRVDVLGGGRPAGALEPVLAD